MASLSSLTELAQSALLLAITLSLPVVGLAALVGALVSALQAATQLQDATLAHLPRLLAVALALVVAGPWMGAEIARFALEAFAGR
ncbi:MAG TPA: type III secretion system export apparatus subunit SctS [Polyangiaceae bacterium]|nr:type III secretion system export apparatus subunit SctS [Polyangiaceae bacterium]